MLKAHRIVTIHHPIDSRQLIALQLAFQLWPLTSKVTFGLRA